MSLQLINQYQTKLERIIAYGGSRNEGSVRAAFQELLDRYASSKNLALVTELDYKTTSGTTVRPDGTLKNAVRQDVGYWESKDEQDDLDAEIALKFAKGCPDLNILFDDTQQVVLYQNGQEVETPHVAACSLLLRRHSASSGQHRQPPRKAAVPEDCLRATVSRNYGCVEDVVCGSLRYRRINLIMCVTTAK